MKLEDVKRGLLVVHRDSPIGETHEHFYSVSSVNKVIERLVERINNLEKCEHLLEEVLESICSSISRVEEVDTDAGVSVIPEFRYEPTFEFYEDDIKTIKWLQEDNEGMFDFSQLTE